MDRLTLWPALGVRSIYGKSFSACQIAGSSKQACRSEYVAHVVSGNVDIAHLSAVLATITCSLAVIRLEIVSHEDFDEKSIGAN
jgi:hypothetical protein